MLRSSSLRLATFYAAAFVLAVAALGAVGLFTTRAAMSRLFDQRIAAESASLVQEYRTEGLIGVLDAVRERTSTPGALDYGLDDPAGRPLAGRLAGVKARLGWSVAQLGAAPAVSERTRILAAELPGGYRLLIGDDLERIQSLEAELFKRFAIALATIALLGLAAGFGLSRSFEARIAALTGAAEAIIDGDLSRRVPLAGGGDDLGRLAATFNRMLDRISALMESLRQVSSDVAHDLRTPLTRLRGRLETSLAAGSPAARAEAIALAIGELDAILATFSALLRIAQIEGGARRIRLRSVDLFERAATVVEAFAPSAEEAGKSLVLIGGGPVMIEGDPELLAQVLVNLIENGLRHARERARIEVEVGLFEGRPALFVRDDGPGAPSGELPRLFDRFHRLEASRSTPGSGLGLSLVAAVAKLHGAEVSLHDLSPGLECRIVFPLPKETLAVPNVPARTRRIARAH
ncbi:MAG: sensor histidine kinase [Caulobacteraceae bacterium]